MIVRLVEQEYFTENEKQSLDKLSDRIKNFGNSMIDCSEEIINILEKNIDIVEKNNISTNNLAIAGMFLSLSLVCIGYSQTIIAIAGMGKDFNWLMWLIMGIIIIIFSFLVFSYFIFRKTKK